MHENREISSAPSCSDEGRSAKAINQTADTHVLEKSDCAVVPVNQPNKEGRVSAEVGDVGPPLIGRSLYLATVRGSSPSGSSKHTAGSHSNGIISRSLGRCSNSRRAAFWTTLVFLLETPPYHYGSQSAGLFGIIGAVGGSVARFPAGSRTDIARVLWCGSQSVPCWRHSWCFGDSGTSYAGWCSE
jgi:hypothetical protein